MSDSLKAWRLVVFWWAIPLLLALTAIVGSVVDDDEANPDPELDNFWEWCYCTVTWILGYG